MSLLGIINSSINSLSNATGHYQRIRTVSKRREFFESILLLLKESPDKASVLFGQDKLLASTKLVDDFIDSEHGILLYTMDCNYYGEHSKHNYSLYLTGDIFRIGLLLSGGVENAPLIDWNNEMNDLWPGTAPAQHNRAGVSLYEWTFAVPDLYDNYVTRERFVLGMRHMQGRILRIVSDYFKIKSEGDEGQPQ